MAGRNRPSYERLVVTADGTPLIESVPADNLSQVTYRDLNGQVHEAPERDDQLPAVYLFGEHEGNRSSLSRELGWQQRIKVFLDEREPAAIWYFVHDGKPDGSGYFVGYERVSNRRIGYIGLSGFRTRSRARQTTGFPCAVSRLEFGAGARSIRVHRRG